MNDEDIKFWLDYERNHPRTWRLESELPVPELPEPEQIDPGISECTQELENDEVCPNRAVLKIGFAFVCQDCFERFWLPT